MRWLKAIRIRAVRDRAAKAKAARAREARVRAEKAKAGSRERTIPAISLTIARRRPRLERRADALSRVRYGFGQKDQGVSNVEPE
jgi:hypothetical protein